MFASRYLGIVITIFNIEINLIKFLLSIYLCNINNILKNTNTYLIIFLKKLY